MFKSKEILDKGINVNEDLRIDLNRHLMRTGTMFWGIEFSVVEGFFIPQYSLRSAHISDQLPESCRSRSKTTNE